jgi:hypothetical protein
MTTPTQRVPYWSAQNWKGKPVSTPIRQKSETAAKAPIRHHASETARSDSDAGGKVPVSNYVGKDAAQRRDERPR